MADAPRFKFYWQHSEGTSVLQMDRVQWSELVGNIGTPILVDVTATPLSAVATASNVVATIANQFASATACVSVIRYDQKDAPTPYNQDVYDVWLDLAQHPKLPAMISAASTSDNANFRQFCREHVFFVKREPGPDHWLPSLPASITVLMNKQ